LGDLHESKAAKKMCREKKILSINGISVMTEKTVLALLNYIEKDV